MSASEPAALGEEGKRAYQQGRYSEAAESFRQAAEGFTLGRAGLLAAEMKNNQSVALLKAGEARPALEAALGTDAVFAGAGDARREGMALGNIAAAREAMGELDEALALYQRAADRFAEAREGDLRATVLKSAAAIHLNQGRLTQSGLKMMGALEAEPRPRLFQRLLRTVLRIRK